MKVKNLFLLMVVGALCTPVIPVASSLLFAPIAQENLSNSLVATPTKKEKLPMNAIVEIKKNGKVYQWGSQYQDTNKNGKIDKGDEGYFSPASTIKILIAALAIEEDGIEGIMNDVRLALVVSDNAAANRLIDKAGGLQVINNELRLRGFEHFILSRKFGEEPRGDGACREGNGAGNCASATDLIRSLEAVQKGNTFNLTNRERAILKKILTMKPKDIGVNKPDNYCRFLPSASQEKCGVTLASVSRSYLSIGMIGDAFVFIAVFPDKNKSEDQIIKSIQQIVNSKLKEIP